MTRMYPTVGMMAKMMDRIKTVVDDIGNFLVTGYKLVAYCNPEFVTVPLLD